MEDAPQGLGRGRLARAALVAGPACFLALWCLPLGLEDPARRLAAIMALVVCFWIGEPIPVAVTALLGPTLAVLLGAVPGETARVRIADAYAEFGDPILMLFIGGFFIAEAMRVHGLDRRIALGILGWKPFGASPGRMVAGLGVCSCLLSMWMSNTAVTALMIPIAAGMLAALGEGGRRAAAPAMLMLSFAATVGGLGTPVGTAPNLIGIAQIEKLSGIRVGFLSWMALCAPVMLAMLAAVVLLMSRGLGAAPAPARAVPGPWGAGERSVAAVFLLAVGLWMASGLAQIWKGSAAQLWFEGHLPEGGIALLAASLLFVLPGGSGRPALLWREAVRIDWGTLFLLGGGLALGDLMLKTGLADAIGTAAVRHLGVTSLWGLTAAAAGMAILLSEITSNTATATMLVPVVIGIAQQAGLPVLPPALAATLGCSFGFMLPVSTPPNALVYGTGRVPIAFMVRRGLALDLMGWAVLVAGLRLLCPLLGMA